MRTSLNKRRVVVTGCGGLTALGHDWPSIRTALRENRTGIVYMNEWDGYRELHTRLGAPAQSFELPSHYNRKIMRGMGRVSTLSVRASELALEDAGLLGDPVLREGRTGIAYGSSAGSIQPIIAAGRFAELGTLRGAPANSYVQMMAQTGAVNIGVFFKITGRLIPTCSACTSGSQGIGYSYETILDGRQDVMVAGGADELSVISAVVFDMIGATSTMNKTPERASRPFDSERDGIVVGEGGATLIMEELEHARARGAKIYAEIVGFASNTDGTHITRPNRATMAEVMRSALNNAQLEPERIGYVSAHATGTDRGDIAESQATLEVLGNRVPVSSMKGYFGHSIGACGPLEAWLAIQMMNEGWFAPTRNLDVPGEDIAPINHVRGKPLEREVDHIMSNNFAFGGINTSLIFRRWREDT
ncbi:MAG: beta-ketoacyl-ACP synthase [Gammaproteobacteria bacterium]